MPAGGKAQQKMEADEIEESLPEARTGEGSTHGKRDRAPSGSDRMWIGWSSDGLSSA